MITAIFVLVLQSAGVITAPPIIVNAICVVSVTSSITQDALKDKTRGSND